MKEKSWTNSYYLDPQVCFSQITSRWIFFTGQWIWRLFLLCKGHVIFMASQISEMFGVYKAWLTQLYLIFWITNEINKFYSNSVTNGGSGMVIVNFYLFTLAPPPRSYLIVSFSYERKFSALAGIRSGVFFLNIVKQCSVRINPQPPSHSQSMMVNK